MAYIRARVIQGKTYYYLVESRREGKKVRQKTLKYLGTELPTIGKASQPKDSPGREGVLATSYQCERCGHKWKPTRKDHYPRVCPGCKSPYWDKPRERKSRGVK